MNFFHFSSGKRKIWRWIPDRPTIRTETFESPAAGDKRGSFPALCKKYINSIRNLELSDILREISEFPPFESQTVPSQRLDNAGLGGRKGATREAAFAYHWNHAVWIRWIAFALSFSRSRYKGSRQLSRGFSLFELLWRAANSEDTRACESSASFQRSGCNGQDWHQITSRISGL